MNAPVQKLSTTHEMIANWILANPGGTYRQMGAHFGYTVSWLCQVCTSDLFRAYMAERMRDVNLQVNQDIPSMLRGAAVLAIERVTEVLEKSEDAEVLVDAFDKVMHRYGYAPNAKASPAAQGPIMQQNNVFFLNQEQLSSLRGKLLDAHKAEVLPEKEIDGSAEMPSSE